ncbi:P-loop NTPase family protein [Paenibacillus cymbidii]|uniref:ATPase n=1 Tax=Paenibacillus cymbidii TaxID=1639034 RepID=UPI0010809E7D|nr:ATPase [Paenibacillus cymbidii]
MSRVIRFIQLVLLNFAGVRSVTVDYTDLLTALTGKNGEGKSTIGGAPSWIFYGTDLFGGKYNPTPTTYEFDRVYASLLFTVDGTQYLLARGIEGGDNKFWINDVPAKAKEYETFVAGLFDRKMFLSLYNPAFFFSQHWTDQRAMLMQHMSAPLQKTVLAEMSRTSPEQKPADIVLNPYAAALTESLKKHSIDDLQKIHGGTGGQKSKLEKQHIADKSRTQTLRDQLAKMPVPEFTKEVAEAEVVGIDSILQNLATQRTIAVKIDTERRELERQKAAADADYAARVTGWKALEAEEVADSCKTCERPFDEESRTAAAADKERRMKEYMAGNKPVVERRKELLAKLADFEIVSIADIDEQIAEHQEQRRRMVAITEDGERRAALAKQIDEAAAKEAATLASLKESTLILDAIKAYKAKEAELQAADVQALFTRLSVRLFKYVASRDEYDPDFSIQMDGKDYIALSTGERIAAGLELTDVLYKLSDLIPPTFIDGIGEYTGDIAVYGQSITARAVKGKALGINETEVDVLGNNIEN